MSDSTKAFRNRLVSALKDRSQEFSFSELAEDCGVSQEEARSTAESLIRQVYVRAAQDGVISKRERGVIDSLLKRLEFPASKREQLLKDIAESEIHKRTEDAKADGVITPEEKQELDALRKAFQLETARVTCECECGARFRVTAAKTRHEGVRCPDCGFPVVVRQKLSSEIERQLECPECRSVMFPDTERCLACGYWRQTRNASLTEPLKFGAVEMRQSSDELQIRWQPNFIGLVPLAMLLLIVLPIQLFVLPEWPFRLLLWAVVVGVAYFATLEIFNRQTITFTHNSMIVNGGPVPGFGWGTETRPVSDISTVFVKQVERRDNDGEKWISNEVHLSMKNGTKEPLIDSLTLDGAIQLTERLERFLKIEIA
jgi:tellurite resistance protein/DNA-directed RNA polymerase subunit RPC12/RpoP